MSCQPSVGRISVSGGFVAAETSLAETIVAGRGGASGMISIDMDELCSACRLSRRSNPAGEDANENVNQSQEHTS